jgi:uncharacterized protein
VIVLGLVLAAVIGLTLGLLGGGGSILTVPVFVYVLGFGPKEAIAMSLAVVGATSLFGAAGHWRAGNVNLRVALVFGAVAMVGTFGGARLASLVSGAFQLALFAVVMLAAAVFMLRDRRPDPVAHPDRPGPGVALVVVEGLAVGLLTGLVGVGGGFLIVPALVLLARIPMKQAVGTSLLVIAMKSLTGFLGYVDQVSVDWGFMAGFTAASIGGILAGAYLVRYVRPDRLKRAFAVFLLVMGAYILYRNGAAFLPHRDAAAPPARAAAEPRTDPSPIAVERAEAWRPPAATEKGP